MEYRRSCFCTGFLWVAVLLTAFLTAGLTACTGTGTRWNPDDYTVKSGDTVYSIAWRYELDPEEFAAWNNLSDSGLIRPGQRLHTRKPAGYRSPGKRYSAQKPSSTASSSSSRTAKQSSNRSGSTASRSWKSGKNSSAAWVKVRKGDSLSRISARTGVSVKRLAQLNQLKKPYVIKPGQTIYLRPISTASKTRPTTKSGKSQTRKTGVKQTSATSARRTTASSKYSWPKTVRWHWPAKGKVVKKFNRKRSDAKGIDIKGRSGNTIKAAASGKVVYSGDGLISYGNLIIIKHNASYLSAYAYNRRLLVKEGDRVKSGQKIAEMGQKDKLGARLHFEIRKNGKPVDPLKYLPW